MSTQTELRQEITNRIIESLKSGNLPPWRQPWSSHINAGSPTNVISKKRYSGVNPMLLRIAAARHGLKSKYWATFNQWQDLGGKVMRRPDHVHPGQSGTSVVVFKLIIRPKLVLTPVKKRMSIAASSRTTPFVASVKLRVTSITCEFRTRPS